MGNVESEVCEKYCGLCVRHLFGLLHLDQILISSLVEYHTRSGSLLLEKNLCLHESCLTT